MTYRLAAVCLTMVALLASPALASANTSMEEIQAQAELAESGLAVDFRPDPLHLVSPPRSFDTEHIRLDLDVDFDNASVNGNVTQRLRSLRPDVSSIQLNCVGINIHSVSLDGHGLEYEYPVASEHLTSWMNIDDADETKQNLLIHFDPPLQLNEVVNLRIDYDCSPQTGLYFQPAEKEQYPEVWSQGEGESNRYWIPCFDYPNDKATFEGIFRVPQGFYALSNGNLVSRKDIGDQTEFRWKLDEPQVSYLITLAAAQYAVYEDSWSDVEILYVCPPGTSEETARRCMGITPDIMRCFSERTGIDYPFGKYAQVVVQNFIFGGMENTTATTMHARLVYDEGEAEVRDETYLVAHELAHQWWGDMVTMREWNHMWLNEGFAKYFEEVYRDWHEGDDACRISMADSHGDVIRNDNRDPRPLVVDFYNRQDNRNNANIYTKGASVLHMMRGMLGDELFYSVLNHYGNAHRYDFAETPDLATAVKEVTGENLDWFFEQWVYMAGHPQLKVARQWDRERGNLALTIEQTQEVKDLVPLFRLPMHIEITDSSGQHSYDIVVDQASEVFNFPMASDPLMVIVDKGDWLLKELDFPHSREQWLYMLEHGDGPSRLQALRGLKEGAGDDAVFAALRDEINSSDLIELRRAALSSLSEERSGRVYELLLALLDSPEGRLRKDASNMLRNFKGHEGLAERLVLALHEDPAWDVRSNALDALIAIDYDKEKCKEEALYAISLDGDRHNMQRSGITALNRLKAYEQVDYIRELAQPGNGREYRHTAIGAYTDMMEKIDDGKRKPEAAEYLATMLDDPWSRTRQLVVANLGQLKVRDSVDKLTALADTESLTWLADAARRTADEISSFREEKLKLEDLDAKLAEMQRKIDELEKTVNQLNRERQVQEVQP